MKITKHGNLLVETTNTVYGMLEQGGIQGRIVAYPVDQVIEATGLSRDELEELESAHELLDNPVATLAQLIDYSGIPGRVIRRGAVIA